MRDFIETAGGMARDAASAALGSLVGLQAVWEEAARRGARITPEDEQVASLAGLWAAGMASTLGIVAARDQQAFEHLVASVTASVAPYVSKSGNQSWVIATAVGAGAVVAPSAHRAEKPATKTRARPRAR